MGAAPAIGGALLARADRLLRQAIDAYGCQIVSGPAHRAARLLEVGHGGQVLLSLTAAELIHDQPPPNVSLRDLGEQHLRDLGRQLARTTNRKRSCHHALHNQ